MDKTQQIIAFLKDIPSSDWPSNVLLGQRFDCNSGTAGRAKEKLVAQLNNPIKGEIRKVAIADLVLDPKVQMRPEENKEATARYAEAIGRGEKLPPLLAFEDPADKSLRLTSGFHRRLAYIAQGVQEVQVEVRPGTQQDAILYAVGDNASHGLPRCKQTQRRSVEALLELPGWKKRSTQAIAEATKVSWDLVDAIQKGYGSVTEKRAAEKAGEKRDKGDSVKEVTRNGQTFDVDTKKLGRKGKAPTSEPAPEPLEEVVAGADLDPVADEESWLASLPLTANANIDQDAFKAQALAYRRLQDLLAVYREAVAAELPEGQDFGQFGDTLRAVVRVQHPRDWKVCPVCKGKGKAGKAPCSSCKGGFHVR